MSTFERDPEHWLFKFSPDEWIGAGLNELKRAEEAYARGDLRAASVGCKRAAGMALNGALILAPNESWGRTYVEHILALAKDPLTPPGIRNACSTILGSLPARGPLVPLRRKDDGSSLFEATRDVMAHAYALVRRREGPS